MEYVYDENYSEYDGYELSELDDVYNLLDHTESQLREFENDIEMLWKNVMCNYIKNPCVNYLLESFDDSSYSYSKFYYFMTGSPAYTKIINTLAELYKIESVLVTRERLFIETEKSKNKNINRIARSQRDKVINRKFSTVQINDSQKMIMLRDKIVNGRLSKKID
jgi:hypothetical protein